MEIIHGCCCGVDVHAKSLVVCLIKNGRKQIRTYSTMTDDLLALLDWLVSEGCQQVAIESTGVYWKPVFNILEGVLEVVLVNARHVKAGNRNRGQACDLRFY
jgi:transposase